MQYLKNSLAVQTKAAILRFKFSWQPYHQSGDILCENYGRWYVRVNAQFRKIYNHLPVEHEGSSRIVIFAKVTNLELTKVAKHSDSIWIQIPPRVKRRAKFNNEKNFPKLREQYLQFVQYRPLLRGNLVFFFKKWVASKVVIRKRLLAQTNSSCDRSKFQAAISQRKVLFLQTLNNQAKLGTRMTVHGRKSS